MRDSTAVRIAALIVLGAVLIAAIAGMTVVAVMTERDLRRVEVMTFVGAVLLTVLGGLSVAAPRRRGHWTVRTQEPDEPEE